VKKINILFLTAVLLCFTGCEDKKPDTTVKKSTPDLTVNKNTIEDSNKTKETNQSKKYTFSLSDLNESNYSVSIKNKHIEISTVNQKLILLNFFATGCPPCKGEIPYLADLQKKYKGRLFIAGILVNDNPDKKTFKTFTEAYGINYFISNAKDNDALSKLAAKPLQLDEDFPIPLTILFKNGNYYSHYEGAVPVEMVEHDIKEAIHKE